VAAAKTVTDDALEVTFASVADWGLMTDRAGSFRAYERPPRNFVFGGLSCGTCFIEPVD
jgi:hypothetical protein